MMLEAGSMSYNNRNLHRRSGTQNRGFVASLSPGGQINEVLADMNNLKGGYDLRNWSASARRELLPSLTIILEVYRAHKTMKIKIPKLAMLVASPTFRAHMLENPEARKLGFTHEDISLEAVKTIAKWLRNVCTDAEFPTILVPNDLGDALQLRLTAYKLGMHQYVEHIEARYIKGNENRVPSLREIASVIDNTRAEYKNDPILVALANRLSYLCRYGKVSQEEEVAYANLLAEEKFGRLLDAVQEVKVRAMAEDA